MSHAVPRLVLAVWTVTLGVPAGITAAELTAAAVASKDGDGGDRRGNTADDTWQFWFNLAHLPGQYRRLDLHSTTSPAGIPGKVTGPVAAATPNPADTQGWIYHSDWDGRFEGFWGDAKAGQVLAHPYNEKAFGGDVAVTYRVPADGAYDIAGKVSYVRGVGAGPKAGVTCKVGVCSAAGDQIGGDLKWLFEGGAGRPGDSGVAEFTSAAVALKQGQLVILAVDPAGFWGGDMTRIDAFTIVPTAR